MRKRDVVIAGFMIVILLTVPVYVADAYSADIPDTVSYGSEQALSLGWGRVTPVRDAGEVHEKVESEELYASIIDIYASGDAGVEQYLRAQDTWTSYVDVDLDDNVTKDQILIGYKGNTGSFDNCELSNQDPSCTNMTDYWRCWCNFTVGNDIPDYKSDFTFTLLDDDGNVLGDIKGYSTYKDESAGIMQTGQAGTQLNITQDQGIVYATFRTGDNGSYATNGPDGSGCSGLRKIEFFANGGLVKALEVETQPGLLISECWYPATGNKTVNLTVPRSGFTEFYMKVYDNVGNEPAIVGYDNMSVDIDPPDISDTFEVYVGTQKMEYIKTRGNNAGIHNAELKFKIREHNLTRVIVNRTMLNILPVYQQHPLYQEHELDVGSDCSKEGEEPPYTYTCRLGEDAQTKTYIYLNDVDARLEVTAYDSQGMNKTEVSTFIFIEDNVNGFVEFIGTDRCNDDQCFVNKDASQRIYAEIDEGESGFNNSWFYMSMGSLGVQPDPKRFLCVHRPDFKWECSTVVNLSVSYSSGDVKQIKVNVANTADDAGNKVEGEIEAGIGYDTEPPTNMESRVISIRPNLEKTKYHMSEDLLQITLNGTDDSSGVVTRDNDWNVWVDLSGMLADPNVSMVKAHGCSMLNENDWSCYWEVGPAATKFGPGPMNFLVGDVAGNENSSYFHPNFTIYEYTNNTRQRWKMGSVKCSPEKIDRTHMEHFRGSVKEYCRIKLQSSYKALNIELRDVMGNKECWSENISNRVFQDAYLYGRNVAENGRSGVQGIDVFLVIDFNSERLPEDVDMLEYTCPLYIVSADDTRGYPEEELNISITLPVEDSGRSPAESISKEIERTRKDLKGGLFKLVGSLEGLVAGLTSICNIAILLFTAANIINGVDAAMDILRAWGAGKSVADAMDAFNKAMSQAALSGWQKTFVTICNYVSCKYTIWTYLLGEDNQFDYIMNFLWGNGLTEHLPNNFTSETLGEMIGTTDIRSSLVLSVINLCIPGIVENLEKARQIECRYLYCLEKGIPAGLDMYYCQAERYEGRCFFVIGQVWSLVPFNQLVKGFGNLLSEVLEQSWQGLVVSASCWGFGQICSFCLAACNFVKLSEQLVEAYSHFTSASTWQLGSMDIDYCEKVELEEEGE